MIVITGASDGLGRALAELYVATGKRVIGISRGPVGEGVDHLPADLTDEHAIASVAHKINNESEKIEALINCAGVLSIESVEDLTAEQVDKVLGVNVRAPLLLTSALMKKIKQDGADIVNVASTVGLKAYPDQAVYGASKWALRGFSANLQVELKDTPCRVISFCTGGFASKIFEKATGEKNNDFTHWMKVDDVAAYLKQILELPKNMEVSEVVLNRKAV